MPKLSSVCSVTCKDFPKEIPPYSDIGGIGVTLAFIVTAWLIVVVLIGYYVKTFDPRLDPFRQEDTQTLCKHPNAVDYSIHKMLRKVPGLGSTSISDSARPPKLKAVLTNCVLMFADIQIFTALAILISAFVSLGCDIVAYRWQYMIYLAWLASVTHMASLSFLRNHLAKNPIKCIWRLTAMTIIQVLLSVAVGLSTTFDGDPWRAEEGGRPAICYFKERPNTKSVAFQSAIKIMILLIWGLAIRIAKMFEGFEGGLRRIASKLYQQSKERQHGTGGTTTDAWEPQSHTPGSLLKPFLIALLAMLSIQIDLFTSFLAEAYWLLFSTMWITIELNQLRKWGPRDDSEWSFGQILPLILLVAPVAIALESFYTKPNNNVLEITGAPHQNDITNYTVHIRDLQHVDTIAYRGALLLAILSYLQTGVYFVVTQQAYGGLITPVIQLLILMLFFNPLLQIIHSHINTMGTISIRKYIRWLPDESSEPTSTIVVTSPKLKRFVDLRILLPDNDSSWSGQDDPLPLSQLDWAIAGTTVSTEIPDQDGNLTSHSTFHQWISSRELGSDAGFMYPQPDSLTLEKGSMVNPDTGIDTAYEELWHDATPTAVPGDSQVRALVLQTEDDENGVRGSVVKLGCYVQGLLRVGDGITLERWEWKEGGWKRTVRIGDAELPCEKIVDEEALKEGDAVDIAGRAWNVIEASGHGESNS
ncbi:hypothetical protein KAF25_004373 [Fusarium avenaceum]|uniref:Protein HRI1 n=1 Tax=Fusarium avenaceum TaxID=40199 RepID=A0A9P7H5F2_9HYPO|nr:hypothetical protein KAF25_004373 [Fusarium avenaceum]